MISGALRMKKNRIQLKMILLIFITLVPLLILKMVNTRTTFKSSIEAELASNEDFAQAINSSFMNFLNRTWSSQYAIGMAIATNPQWSTEDITKYLKSILPGDKILITYAWINPEAKVVASTLPELIGENMFDRDYFQAMLSGQEHSIGNLRSSLDNKNLIIPLSRKIRVNGELKGIIVSAVDITNLHSIFSFKRQREGSIFGLVDKNGTIVYRSNIKNIPFEKRKVAEDSPVRKALKGEITKIYSRHSIFDGTEKIGIAYPISEIGWSSFAATSVNEVLSDKVAAHKKDIFLFLIVYVISFAIAIILGNRFLASVRKLQDISQEVINGNLNAKVNFPKNHDLSDIGHAFDSITDKLNNRIKEVEEYDRLKTQFLATMSHELKTPLNIILGCIQLLEKLDTNKDSFKDSFGKYVKMQKQNSYRLLRLINNLIDFNKAEVKNFNICLTNADIVQVVEDITLSIVEYTSMKNINLVFDTEVEEKIMAFDLDMIERIMLNLLSNAIKFTNENGNIEVNIYDRNKKVIISVKDNGIGIPEDKLTDIFDRFTQVDSTLRRKSEGSGIGLSLVKSLVEMHNGTITVKSILGEGSEFIIELPVKLAEEDCRSAVEKNISNVERTHIEFSDIYM